ncbi:hypothetical protein OH77DRAFT_698162 [Trametes cingulata]|nr:hypothetical protein OH77DRAFT_698162 [Trametes cingulata]
MDYSNTYGTPTPAPTRPGAVDEPKEREDEGPEENDEEVPGMNTTPDEGQSRGRKRPRVRSPVEDEIEDWTPEGGKGSQVGPESMSGKRESHASDDEESLRPRRSSTGRSKSGDLPAVASEAPPPYPSLPSAEDCEKLIDTVVREAADNLRAKLRELVEHAQGRTKQSKSDHPPASQESLEYWQHYTDPTEVLQQNELERILSGHTLWGEQQQAAAPPTSLLAFPDINYGDMATLYGRSVPRNAPLPPAPQGVEAEEKGRGLSATTDPRARASKGKERQREAPDVAMEVDNPFAKRGAPLGGSIAAAIQQARHPGEAAVPDAPQEMDREMAEEQRREALRRKWEEANLSTPIADTEASGQPEYRRLTNDDELRLAMKLRQERAAEIEKLGLAPLLEHGNPAVHANCPRDRVRNIPETKLKEWRTKTAGTYVLLDVYGEGDIEDTDAQRIYDNLQAALHKITGLQNVALEQPPRTPRTVSKEHATTVWFASGLYPAAVALLTMVHAWPTADITFFAYREIEFIPRYLFAVKGFTQSDQNEVRLAVWEIFHKAPVYPSILSLVRKNPDFVGMDHTKVVNDIISTVEVAVRPVNEERHARLITHVYMTSPTRSAATWESWRDGLRYPIKGKAFSEEHAHLEISQRITRCKACHGADHLTTQCPYGHLEGWAKIVEGTSARRPDQWRAKTPRAGQGHHASEHGNVPAEEETGGPAWTYAEGRGGAFRSRGMRGGGVPRGMQTRSRRT